MTAAPLARLLLLLVFAGSCARSEAGQSGTEEGGGGDGSDEMSFPTQPADPDPCSWVTTGEVAAIVGPLEGSPQRVRAADDREPAADGRACLYVQADRSTFTAGTGEVAIQVLFQDATLFEYGTTMVLGSLGAERGTDLTAGDADLPAGWDWVGGLPDLWSGRQGHVAVHIGLGTMTVPAERVRELAILVRDRVPDVPVAQGRSWGSGGGPDPCLLLRRDEVEAVAGPLPVPPYRSESNTPFAGGDGQSCTWYLGQHRVLVLTPNREDGQMLFEITAVARQVLVGRLDQGEAADTLDGPWDQAGEGIAGLLVFLKGDRMLTVDWKSSGLEAAAAVRLAARAVERLEEQP